MPPALKALDQARKLNQAVEQSFMALAMVLVDIEEHEHWRAEHDSFAEFYTNDLGRKKSDVSMLLKVGKWIKEQGFIDKTEGTSYTKLYHAINSYPTKKPELVLEASKTLSVSEIRQEGREVKHPNCKHEETITICANCHARV